MGKKSFWSFVWRGALGGAAGGFLWFLVTMYRLWPNIPYFNISLILGPLLMMFMGGGMGVIVGTIIWVIELKTRASTPLLLRALIGAVLTITVSGIAAMISDNSRTPLWGRAAIVILIYGMTVGTFAGLMTGIATKDD